MDRTYSQQDVIDVAWTYECYWSLVWALKLVNKIDMPDLYFRYHWASEETDWDEISLDT